VKKFREHRELTQAALEVDRGLLELRN